MPRGMSIVLKAAWSARTWKSGSTCEKERLHAALILNRQDLASRSRSADIVKVVEAKVFRMIWASPSRNANSRAAVASEAALLGS